MKKAFLKNVAVPAALVTFLAGAFFLGSTQEQKKAAMNSPQTKEKIAQNATSDGIGYSMHNPKAWETIKKAVSFLATPRGPRL